MDVWTTIEMVMQMMVKLMKVMETDGGGDGFLVGIPTQMEERGPPSSLASLLSGRRFSPLAHEVYAPRRARAPFKIESFYGCIFLDAEIRVPSPFH